MLHLLANKQVEKAVLQSLNPHVDKMHFTNQHKTIYKPKETPRLVFLEKGQAVTSPHHFTYEVISLVYGNTKQ